MTTPSECRLFADALALGEHTGELSAHAATCANCQRLVAATGVLRRASVANQVSSGFVARAEHGARDRLRARQRARWLGGGFAVACAAATTAYVATRSPASSELTALQPSTGTVLPEQPASDDSNRSGDKSDNADELALDRELARKLNTDRAMFHILAPSRAWRRVEHAMAPYRLVVDHAQNQPASRSVPQGVR